MDRDHFRLNEKQFWRLAPYLPNYTRGVARTVKAHRCASEGKGGTQPGDRPLARRSDHPDPNRLIRLLRTLIVHRPGRAWDDWLYVFSESTDAAPR